MQFLNLGIRGCVLELLGGLRDFVLDGRTPFRRVVGDRDVVARRIDDGRKRFVLIGGPLNRSGRPASEAGTHCGVDA